MKKIASIALALSLASTAAFAQGTEPVTVGSNVTALAPAGTAAVAGTTVTIAGIGTATWVVVSGVLLLLVTELASDTTTGS